MHDPFNEDYDEQRYRLKGSQRTFIWFLRAFMVVLVLLWIIVEEFRSRMHTGGASGLEHTIYLGFIVATGIIFLFIETFSFFLKSEFELKMWSLVALAVVVLSTVALISTAVNPIGM